MADRWALLAVAFLLVFAEGTTPLQSRSVTVRLLWKESPRRGALALVCRIASERGTDDGVTSAGDCAEDRGEKKEWDD